MKRLSIPVRSRVLRLLTSPPLAGLWKRLPGASPTVLMFHRFEDRNRGSRGFPADLFREMLRYLRRGGYALLDLEELIRISLAGDPLPRRSITITIDDGYLDQFEIAVPILAEFDAPATIFPATGFLDRSSWMWWDKIEHLLTVTDRPRVETEIGGAPVRYELSSVAARMAVAVDLAERCKRLDMADSSAAIEQLAERLGIEVPAEPPPQYLPMTWDQVRIAERFGIRFGPSTVTHPVLSRVDDPTAAWEIEESCRRVTGEAANPMPVFCYPNGTRADFGERERRLLRGANLLGAVTAEPGYWTHRPGVSAAVDVFDIPRFSGPESMPHLVKVASGFERFFMRESRAGV